MGPSWAWRHIYEPLIRRAAGLGRPPREPDPDRYQRTFDHCGVLVVGTGPAGLAAALSASESGARVVVCDENAGPGGSLLAETESEIEGKSARAWLADALAALRSAPNVRLMPRTQAFGYYAQNFIGLNERIPEANLIADPELPRERYGRCARAKSCWRPARSSVRCVFPDNDRPAVMLAHSARRYARPDMAEPWASASSSRRRMSGARLSRGARLEKSGRRRCADRSDLRPETEARWGPRTPHAPRASKSLRLPRSLASKAACDLKAVRIVGRACAATGFSPAMRF